MRQLLGYSRDPTLRIKVYEAYEEKRVNSFSLDTDGLPFTIDNAAPDAICNENSVSASSFKSKKIQLRQLMGCRTLQNL